MPLGTASPSILRTQMGAGILREQIQATAPEELRGFLPWICGPTGDAPFPTTRLSCGLFPPPITGASMWYLSKSSFRVAHVPEQLPEFGILDLGLNLAERRIFTSTHAMTSPSIWA